MQLSLGLTLFIDALNKAYVPWFYKSLSGFKNFKTIKDNQIKFYIMISISIPLSFLFTSDVFAFLFGENYRAVSEVFPYIIAAQVFSAFYIYQANFLLFFKKNLTLSAITIFSGVVYIPLLSYLTQAHGMVGAGSSFVIAMLVRYCITWYFSTRSFNEYKNKIRN
jgi:O-antigen/teichoic acid export membrane protein